MLNLTNHMFMHNFVYLIITDNENNTLLKDLSICFTNKEQELNEFKRIVIEEKIDAVILDMLHYSQDYIKDLKTNVKKTIVSFHEYNDISIDSDLAINYNFFDDFQTKSSEIFLAGPKYIIFNNELTKVTKKYIKEDYIFVSFGGSDPSSLIQIFIQNIASKMTHNNFYIHIGNFDTLDIDNIKGTNNITFLNKPSNLFEYMASAKYAITAAGNIMYELIYLKVPSIVIAHNSHQDEFAKNAARLGCVNYMGLSNDLDFSLLRNEIESMSIKSYNCKQEIDALGIDRIKSVIEELVN